MGFVFQNDGKFLMELSDYRICFIFLPFYCHCLKRFFFLSLTWRKLCDALITKVYVHVILMVHHGPVVQSIVSLTSLLVVKMLTVLASTISNSQVFLLKKCVSSFCKCKSYSHFFSKNISINAIFNDLSFNDMLTNDIVSFELMGPQIQRETTFAVL